MSKYHSPINKRKNNIIFSPTNSNYNSNATTLSSSHSRLQRKIYTLSPTNNNIIKNSNIYNEIKRIFDEGKYKKIEKKGKIEKKRASIFHIKNKNKINLPELKIDNLNKVNKFKHPNLTKHNHLNNFLLRSIDNENDEKNFIINSKKKEELNDDYYKINNIKLKNQTNARLKRFENYKNLHIYEAKFLDGEQNLDKKMKRDIENINIHVKYKKKKKKKSRNIFKNFNLDYLQSERLYNKTKIEHEKYFKNKITEQGFTLSRNLTLLKNEDVESMDSDDEDNDNKNNEVKIPILFKNNLYHTIELYKILKSAKDLNCIGNNDEDDDEVDIDNVNKFKQERNELEYKVAVLAKDKKIPKYLKGKLNSTTINKFKGVTGKLFGT